MKYFILFFLFYSSSVFSNSTERCGDNIFYTYCSQRIASLTNATTFAYCKSTDNENLKTICWTSQCQSPFVNDSAHPTTCLCPEGTHSNTIITGSGTEQNSCIDDDPPQPDECNAPQVMYEGFCRDPEDSPDDCGSTYSTAIAVGGGFICGNGGCSAGQNASVYTTANGSWNVCGDNTPPSSSIPPTSSPSNGSAPSNTSAGSNTSSGSGDGSNDNGSGSGSGSGSGNGTGTGVGDGSGSGNTSAASSSVGSGSGTGEQGDGDGSATAADCSTNPACDGDPVQCAILTQLWLNNCKGFDDTNTNNPVNDNQQIQANFEAVVNSPSPTTDANGQLTALGSSGSSGGDGSGNGDGNCDGDTCSGSAFDFSGLDGAAASGAGGTCPSDRSITLALGTYNISYQPLCDFAGQISGLVILIFSYLGSVIIYRAIEW